MKFAIYFYNNDMYLILNQKHSKKIKLIDQFEKTRNEKKTSLACLIWFNFKLT